MSDNHDPASAFQFSRDISANEHLLDHKTSTAKTGFFRAWFATSTDLRPTPDSREVKWGIHWYTPVTIVLLLVLGIASATAHHFFYSHLHDETVGDEGRQRWVFWIGSSLGFFTKVSFTSVLAISRTQWVWVTLRKKSMTLGGIDALFGVSSDLTFFKNYDMLRHAKFATVMAIMMWIFPLTAILTPGTISVATVPQISELPCTVRTVLFPFDQNSTATLLAGNDTSVIFNTGIWSFTEPPQFVWSSITDRVLTWSSYSGTIKRQPNLLPPTDKTPPESTLPQICDYSCTYTVEFLGPAITCSDVTSWDEMDFPWYNPLDFMSGTLYRATAIPGELIVGVNITSLAIVDCRKSIVRYTVQQVIQNRTFNEPIILAVGQTQYPVPQMDPVFPETVHLVNDVLFSIIQKTLQGNSTQNVPIVSEVTQTTFYDAMLKDSSTVGLMVERMAHTMAVSLIAFDYITQNDARGILDVAAFEDTMCTSTKIRTVYIYSAQTLIIVYSISVAAAVWMALAGFVALGRNGVASNRSVSAIIRTTRNPTLDRSIGGSCLGGDPMPKELEKLELQFGALRPNAATTGQQISSFALGVKGEIDPIKRRGRYS